MADDRPFHIRPMLITDLEQAMGLSVAEGWNQTEKDWRLLIENPMNICLVAEYQSRVAGTATALNHSNEVAWIGMVLVDNRLRGQGAGKLMLTGIIDKLRHVESIKLDATPAGLPLYQKLGFLEEFNIFRMINTSPGKFIVDNPDFEIKLTDAKNIAEVLEHDKIFFGSDRSYLLRSLLHNHPGKSYILRRNNRLDGYIFGRNGLRFNYLGPVFAFSNESARILIEKGLELMLNKPVALDILSDKEDLINWLESIGFVKQRYFVRMFLKSNSHSGLIHNQYLISGPEFG